MHILVSVVTEIHPRIKQSVSSARELLYCVLFGKWQCSLRI